MTENSEKIHIERNTVQETLVIPLFSRKLCTEVFGDFFTDESAAKLIEKLDYDFSELENNGRKFMPRFMSLEVGARQNDFGFEIDEYLKRHPKASIINLGCGLDQTAEYHDNTQCRIYN